MLPALLILSLVFAGLFVARLAGSERRLLLRRWPAFLLAGAAVFAAARGAYSLALLAAAAAVFAWVVLPWTANSSIAAAPDDPADAAARAVLGVGANASVEDIRAAYRAKMARAHPDRGGSHEAAAKLTAARDRLLRRRR